MNAVKISTLTVLSPVMCWGEDVEMLVILFVPKSVFQA